MIDTPTGMSYIKIRDYYVVKKSENCILLTDLLQYREKMSRQIEHIITQHGKDKAIPLQAWIGP
jgi:hypothetical protein